MPRPDEPLEIDSSLRAALERIGHEFQIDFLGGALQTRGDDLGLLTDLAHALTRVGRFDEGLALDRRIVELAPQDPLAHYNLACSLSLIGAVTQALEELTAARDLGWSDLEHARNDPDLSALHGLPEFSALFDPAREHPTDGSIEPKDDDGPTDAPDVHRPM